MAGFPPDNMKIENYLLPVEKEKAQEETPVKKEVKKNVKEEDTNPEAAVANKMLWEIRSLKRQNWIKEQQEKVHKLKEEYGSYRAIKQLTATPLKTLHEWCSLPKEKNTQSNCMCQFEEKRVL